MKLKGAFCRKAALTLLLLFAVVLFLGGCGEKKVASVNGEAITQKEFEQRLATVQQYYEANLGIKFEEESGAEMLKYLQEMVLDQMVTEHILLQEARKQGVKAAKEEVQQRIDQDKLMVGGEKAYLDILKNQLKMSEREYTQEVEKQIMIEKLYEQVVAGITVGEEEVQKYYQENIEQFALSEQVRARHILVATEAEGNAIIQQLKNGADFAQLAVEKSIDPTAKENQGDLNYFAKDSEFDTKFTEAAFKLKTGEMTLKPVKTDFGYHVIKVEDRKPAHQQTLEEVKDSIIEELKTSKESEKFQQYVEDLRQQAKIEKEELPAPAIKTNPDPVPSVTNPPAENPPNPTEENNQ
ncbi:MAG: hypothetical protein GX295_05940 [Syntrophomonadaceae bacterium]|nr:hypothetical protein [Syntrophomonadaceae bacterium]